MSVIVPTFQRRDYVLRALASVLAQTFEDFELIVVDDGSTDGTEEALAGFDPRLRYQWQENRGTGAARNAGLRVARGEIVAFLDSDNRWLPQHLAVVTDVLALFPEAVLACTCPREHIAGRQNPRKARLVDFLPHAYADSWIGFISCMGIRRSDLLSVGGFDERLTVMEDGELELRLAERGPFAFVQHRTIVHQTTRGSRIERGSREATYLEAFEFVSRTGLEVARTTQRSDRATLLAYAGGRLHFSAAMRELAEGERESARASLEHACSGLPALSRRPEVVARRIGRVPRERHGKAEILAAAATLWPDQRSDTALYLRMTATVAALRTGRPREAVRLLRGWPIGPTPAFLLRNLPRWVRLTRLVIRRRRNRGEESQALQATIACH